MTDPSMNLQERAPKIAPRILCIGIPVRDLTFRTQRVPARGSKRNATHFEEICGGNSLNAAIGIVRLGGRAAICGPMGDARETASRYIFDQLANEGIDAKHLVHMNGLVTPLSGIMIDPTGERTIITFRDPALWKVKLPPADVLLEDCDAILTESRCAEFCTDLCAEAVRRGIPVVVDVDRAMSLSEGLLHGVHASGVLVRAAAGDRRRKRRGRGAEENCKAHAVLPGRHPRPARHDLAQRPRRTAGDARRSPCTPSIRSAPATSSTAPSPSPSPRQQELRQALQFASAAAALKCTRFGGAFAAPQRY